MSDEEKGKEKEAAQSRDGENMLTIGVVGFGNFGQFLGERYAKCGHRVVGTSRKDYTKAAEAIGCEFVATNDDLMDVNPDVIVLCTSIMSLHTVLEHFPIDRYVCALLQVIYLPLHSLRPFLFLLSLSSGLG